MTKDDIDAAVYLPQPAIEIGLLHYPGAQQAAILGLTDLFIVANRIAAAYRKSADPVVSISHWTYAELLQQRFPYLSRWWFLTIILP